MDHCQDQQRTTMTRATIDRLTIPGCGHYFPAQQQFFALGPDIPAYNQGVVGSIPTALTNFVKDLRGLRILRPTLRDRGATLGRRRQYCLIDPRSPRLRNPTSSAPAIALARSLKRGQTVASSKLGWLPDRNGRSAQEAGVRGRRGEGVKSTPLLPFSVRTRCAKRAPGAGRSHQNSSILLSASGARMRTQR